MSDRTVHATTHDGGEIVRYDRAGKWYVEYYTNRYRVPIEQAVGAALAYDNAGTRVRFGLPGGGAFDRLCRREIERRGSWS